MRVRRFLAILKSKMLIQLCIVCVLNHAKSKALIESNIGNVMLQRKTLEPSNRELSLTELIKILRLHELFQTRLNNLHYNRIDKLIRLHSSPFAIIRIETIIRGKIIGQFVRKPYFFMPTG